MGGPAAGVLLPGVPEEHQLVALRAWLGTIAEFHNGATKSDLLEGWEFLLNWPAALGDEPSDRVCLAGLKFCLIDPEAEYSGDSCSSPADWARLSQALGWIPACEFSAWICCNRPQDHKILGWFCAELATRFGGVIDIGGHLPLPHRNKWIHFGLAGKVVETVCDLDADRTAPVHLVDAEFLRSWMLLPQFRMIKGPG